MIIDTTVNTSPIYRLHNCHSHTTHVSYLTLRYYVYENTHDITSYLFCAVYYLLFYLVIQIFSLT